MSILQKTNIAVDIDNGEKVINYLRATERYLADVFSKSKEGKGRDKLDSCLKSLKMALGNYEYIWGSLIKSDSENMILKAEVSSLMASLIIAEKKLLREKEKFEKLKSSI